MARAAVLASEGVWEGLEPHSVLATREKTSLSSREITPHPHTRPQHHSSASSPGALATVEPGKQGLQVSNLCRRKREEVPVLVQHSSYGETRL